jgi:hypothetical protein
LILIYFGDEKFDISWLRERRQKELQRLLLSKVWMKACFVTVF